MKLCARPLLTESRGRDETNTGKADSSKRRSMAQPLILRGESDRKISLADTVYLVAMGRSQAGDATPEDNHVFAVQHHHYCAQCLPVRSFYAICELHHPPSK